jgi:hypothetical protein
MFNAIEVLKNCRSDSEGRLSKLQELNPGPAHTRTEVAVVSRVFTEKKNGSLRFASAPTKEDSSLSVY